MGSLAPNSAWAVATPETREEAGLLTDEEIAAALRRAVGDVMDRAQLEAAVASLREAEAARWEQLPPDIHPDMGFNFPFLACSETCWMGRQILVEGASFRLFRQRG